jgi:hypothetical protein
MKREIRKGEKLSQEKKEEQGEKEDKREEIDDNGQSKFSIHHKLSNTLEKYV